MSDLSINGMSHHQMWSMLEQNASKEAISNDKKIQENADEVEANLAESTGYLADNKHVKSF